ncbi:hypothetical protein D3C73_1275940 [compost metagenome]
MQMMGSFDFGSDGGGKRWPVLLNQQTTAGKARCVDDSVYFSKLSCDPADYWGQFVQLGNVRTVCI